MLQDTQEWLECGKKLVVGDVIRWTEAIWPERKSRRKQKPRGKRRVTAQVLEIDSRDYVRLSVIADEIIENKYGMPLKSLKKDEILVKKLATIARGTPQRLKWADEAQRSVEVSVFLT